MHWRYCAVIVVTVHLLRTSLSKYNEHVDTPSVPIVLGGWDLFLFIFPFKNKVHIVSGDISHVRKCSSFLACIIIRDLPKSQ